MKYSNDWTNVKLLMNMKGESLASNISNNEFDNFQHGHIRHPEHGYKVSDALEGIITILYPQRQKMASTNCDHNSASDTFAKRHIFRDLHQKEGILKFNNDSQGSDPTGDKEVTSSHTMGTNNVYDILGKVFPNHKVELSSRSLDSFECSNTKENDNWQDLQIEAFKSNYLLGNYYCLEGYCNGLKNDIRHDENTPISVTNNANSSN